MKKRFNWGNNSMKPLEITLSTGKPVFSWCPNIEEGAIWIMVLTGSRNIGKKICDSFNKIALGLNQEWYSNSAIPFLPATSGKGREYLAGMNLCLAFAYYNRDVILQDVLKIFLNYFPNMENTTDRIEGVKDKVINIHHNYASLEHHFGKDVWVHRKGATLASDKTIGIIPGSMGTNSYIVKGKGEINSLSSCSHGAGRKMGRNNFNRIYNTTEKLKEIEEQMQGVVHTKFGKYNTKKKKNLDILDVSEAPQAYKDIEEVINNESDLVEVLFKLKPVINWKDASKE